MYVLYKALPSVRPDHELNTIEKTRKKEKEKKQKHNLSEVSNPNTTTTVDLYCDAITTGLQHRSDIWYDIF